MIEIGQYYTLVVVKKTTHGVYLDAENLGDILLPRRHTPKNVELYDTIRVFLYLDSEDRPIATTEQPKACVNEFAYLKVVDTSSAGAFLDWGLDKDVLVPFSEQHVRMKKGKFYLVYLYLNGYDGRITASSKIDSWIDEKKPSNFQKNQEVDLIIGNSTNLGFKAIINHSYWGLLYKDEVHVRLSFGQSIKGYITYVRPDGRIDLSLKDANETVDMRSMMIVDYLKEQGGFAEVHDKSTPQLISELFGMSKKVFKNTIGTLYKQRRIVIESKGIRLVEDT